MEDLMAEAGKLGRVEDQWLPPEENLLNVKRECEEEKGKVTKRQVGTVSRVVASSGEWVGVAFSLPVFFFFFFFFSLCFSMIMSVMCPGNESRVILDNQDLIPISGEAIEEERLLRKDSFIHGYLHHLPLKEVVSFS
ncbi:hypothetical protein Ancab_014178 [Ancistrocladus abbreviatus]